MRFVLMLAALALVAGCDNKSPQQNSPAPASGTSAPPQTSSPSSPQATTPTPPANIGAARSTEEKKEGANPVQGQVDPKQPEQRRDFQQRGDGKGPTSPETAPRGGG